MLARSRRSGRRYYLARNRTRRRSWATPWAIGAKRQPQTFASLRARFPQRSRACGALNPPATKLPPHFLARFHISTFPPSVFCHRQIPSIRCLHRCDQCVFYPHGGDFYRILARCRAGCAHAGPKHPVSCRSGRGERGRGAGSAGG